MLKTNIEVQADPVKSYDKQIGVLCIVLSTVILTLKAPRKKKASENVVCWSSAANNCLTLLTNKV